MKFPIDAKNYDAMCTGNKPGVRDYADRNDLSGQKLKKLNTDVKAGCAAFEAVRTPRRLSGGVSTDAPAPQGKSALDLERRYWVHKDSSANSWMITDKQRGNAATAVPDALAHSFVRLYGEPVETHDTAKAACTAVKEHSEKGEGGSANKGTVDFCSRVGVPVSSHEFK